MDASSRSVPEGDFDAVVAVFDGVTVVEIRGEVDLFVEDEFRRVLLDAIESSRAVVLDLCNCPFMDSRGLHAVIAATRHARTTGVAFTAACTPGEACANVFALALGDMIAVHPTRDAAVAAVSPVSG